MNTGSLSVVPSQALPPVGTTVAVARLGNLAKAFATAAVDPQAITHVAPPTSFSVMTFARAAAAPAGPVASTEGAEHAAAAVATAAAAPHVAPPLHHPIVPPSSWSMFVGPPTKPLPGANAAFITAAGTLMSQLAQPPTAGTIWVEADLDAATSAIQTTLDPIQTIQQPLVAQLAGVDAGPKRTDPLEPVMAAPVFPQPMYAPLVNIGREWLLPGLDQMDPDAIALFATNWSFVESFLVGLNHELARKLLWNGYPTDQRGTYFRRFWDIYGSDDTGGEVGPIHLWTAPLGNNEELTTDPLILLVRGEVIRRYPNVVVYATDGSPTDGSGPPRAQYKRNRSDLLRADRAGRRVVRLRPRPRIKAQGDPGKLLHPARTPIRATLRARTCVGDRAYGARAVSSGLKLSWDALAPSAELLSKIDYIDLDRRDAPSRPQSPSDPKDVAWHANGTPSEPCCRPRVHHASRTRPSGCPWPAADSRPGCMRRHRRGRKAHEPSMRPYPVALLPVRLETRFSGSLLQVRIFPDDIWADTHEPGLTVEELADGNAYLQAKASGSDAEKSSWAILVTRWTAPRAAYIVEAVSAGSTETRAESWTRAAQALLPDQWIVRAYQDANVFTVSSSPVRQPLALTFSPDPTASRVPLSDALSIDSALQWTVDFAAAQEAGMAVTIDLSTPDSPSEAAPNPQAGVDSLVVVGVSDAGSASDGAAQLRALFDAQHYTRGFAFLTPGTATNNTPAVPAGYPTPDPGGALSSPSSVNRRSSMRAAHPVRSVRRSRLPSGCRLQPASRSRLWSISRTRTSTEMRRQPR